MFKRCGYYFIIGMFAFAHMIIAEIYGGNNGSILFFLGMIGTVLFYFMNFLLVIELIISFVKGSKKIDAASKASQQ